MAELRNLSVHIDRPAAEVYAFVVEPANLPRWASGLGGQLVQDGVDWFVETPEGRARFAFVPRNEHGILDHEVWTPSGETVSMPMRAIADGDDECDVVMTLRRGASMTDDDFARDIAAVSHDLEQLRTVLEGDVVR
ncbi:SRPBCC family protein [Cellulomonas sp. PhB150]|uniref:SRPBCC family protein n=1 Tax=Cellulomonas sp. PhB150 TaxID=2485188 RepID=UPI000F4A3F0B|nr:SRPBCC family protein [Cellulomonas sp. PhB150]ROS23998.1 hypothetical protein EDF34_3061 [Cellulomonas sp. PhB150]